MVTVKESGQVRRSLNLKGFRSLACCTGVSRICQDAGRLREEAARLAGRRERRSRRLAEWQSHFLWAAGPCRVLPPQARLRLAMRCSWSTPRKSYPG